MDINELSGSTEVRKLRWLPSSSPILRARNAAIAAKSPPAATENSSTSGELLSAEEKALLQGFSPENIRAIERIKKVFPKARVTEVRPQAPPATPTGTELRYKAIEENLKRKCATRGALMAELGHLWPQILKERSKQRRENCERQKTQVSA